MGEGGGNWESHITHDTIRDRNVSVATQKIECIDITIQYGESNDKLGN